MTARLPDGEAERLAALQDHRILDTPPAEEFDDLVRLAAHLCGVPIAAVSLIDTHRQWFKSIVGLPISETSRDDAFCAHTILESDLMVVPDAEADPRFTDNPLVTGEPHIRFYAGVPLLTEEGHALGSLCVIDRAPRILSPEQEETLRLLARQVSSHLRAVRRVAEQERLVAEKQKLITERERLLAEKESLALEKERLVAGREREEAERLRLAAIIETCDDAIYSMTLHGAITSWNRGAERLYGHNAAAIAGARADLLIPPDRRAEMADILRAVRRGEDLAPLETVRLTRAGVPVDVSLRVSPVQDAEGRVVGASVIARDITQRKRTEAALEAEREFVHALLESLQEGIVACDAQGTLTLFNRATRELHGLPEQPLPPERWAEHFDLYHPDGVTPMQTRDVPLFRVLQGEVVRDAEMVIAPKFGPARVLLASGQAILGRQGEKLGAVVALHDVTERRRAEREISRLAAIVESSQEAILAATLDGTIVSWNRGAERLYGYAAAEMIGQHVSVLTRPGQRSPVPAVVTRLLRGEQVEPIEVARTRRDGTEFHAVFSFSPIRDTSGAIIGLACIARDVTARKQAEEALADSNAALHESEARLRRLTDAAFEGIAVSQDGVLVDVSSAFAALFGYDDSSQMAGLDGAELAAPESRALVAHKIAECDEERYEATLRRRDGATFQAEVRGRKIQLGGRPARVTAVCDISERKAMEAALREGNRALQESQAFIQAVADSSASLIYVFDLDTKSNVYANRGLAEFWGYTPDQIQALGDGLVSRVVHPDDMPAMLGHFGEFSRMPDGQVVEFEMRSRHADGEWRWLSVREVVFNRHADGSTHQIMGTAQDVTQRKAMEGERRATHHALRESQARLAEAQRIAQVGSWEYALDTGRLSWSNELFRLFGLDPAQGEPDYETAVGLYHPEDSPVLAALVAQATQEGSGYALDLRGAPRPVLDGEQRWYHTVGTAVTDAAGRVVRLMGTLADITDRKRMEEALRRNAERLREREAALRAILDSAPVILYAADADGTITLSEGTGLAALGLTPGEAVGRSVFEFSSGKTELEAITRRALSGEAISYDAQIYGLCLHTELRPLRDADGRPAGIIGVCLDVTERMRAEERVKDHAVILEFQKNELEAQKYELERVNEELAALATTDGLTGLHNQRSFQERLAEEVSRASRYGMPLALIILDVDNFKQFNDGHGHPAGDAVLRTVARILQDGARDTDFVARYGGEEFVLVLPQTDLSGAAVFAERLREAIASHPWLVRPVTASFGVSILRPADEGGAEMVARADTALYSAKTAGRNRVTCAADGDMPQAGRPADKTYGGRSDGSAPAPVK